VPLTVFPALRFSFDGPWRITFSEPSNPLCEFDLRLERFPAKPSRPARMRRRRLSWALNSLQHTSDSKVHLPRVFACPLRSALRVWSPSRRLAPFESLPAFFHAGGAHGIHPSELLPLKRFPTRFRAEAPTYRSTLRYSRRKTSRLAKPRFLGVDPLGRPVSADARLTRRPPVNSPGVSPSKAVR
jgi:hypothetical protein